MTIVLGTDLSPLALPAATVAALLAKALGEPLHVVHVSQDPRAAVVLGTPEERLLTEELRSLRALAQELEHAYTVQVSTQLAAGSKTDALCEAAERQVAELLVVGACSSSPGRLGSTAERVVRAARVPVLVVRAEERLKDWLRGRGPLRVLVGSDLGRAARHAEEFVSILHRAGPVAVRVVHVTDPHAACARYDLPPSADGLRLDPRVLHLLERDLESQGDGLSYLAERSTHVISGTASADTHLAILAEEADLVVVGARQRSWIERVWLGSVARGTLQGAPVSVACIPNVARASTTPRKRPRAVVAATDFSELGDETLPVALSLLRDGGTVHLVHVLPSAAYDVPEERTRARSLLLQRLVPEPDSADVRVDILRGDTAEAIVAFGREVAAEALCIGSHGRSGLGALVLGSVSHRVLSLAEVPVTVVPPPRD